jgi:hypothetical protein
MTSPEQGAQQECSRTFAFSFGETNFSLLFKVCISKTVDNAYYINYAFYSIIVNP